MKKVNINDSFGVKFARGVDDFYATKKSFITYMTIVAIISFAQLVSFLFLGLPMAGTNDPTSWIPWAYMAISMPGAALAMIGYVLTVRVDSRFFIPATTAQVFTSFNSFIGGMFWSGVGIIIILLMGIYRYLLIKREGANYKINANRVRLFAVIFTFFFTILGIVVSSIPQAAEVLWFRHGTTGTLDVVYRTFDIITISLAMFASFLLISKDKEAFVFFIICNVIFIILLFISSMWLSMVQIMMFLVSNIFSMIAWNYKKKHKETFE